MISFGAIEKQDDHCVLCNVLIKSFQAGLLFTFVYHLKKVLCPRKTYILILLPFMVAKNMKKLPEQ
jgi:hypothetical protein